MIDQTLLVPDVSDFIYSIPINSQTVDWIGLGASSVPPYPAIVPDDVIPVLAGLQAWKQPMPDAIEKLTTDGKGAMRVKIVNPGASGVAYSQMTQVYAPGDGTMTSTPGGYLIWTTEGPDIGPSMFDVTNPTRLTVSDAGLYLCNASATFILDPTLGFPDVDVVAELYTHVNGSLSTPFEVSTLQLEIDPTKDKFLSTKLSPSVNLALPLNAGDYVEILGLADGGMKYWGNGVFSLARIG